MELIIGHEGNLRILRELFEARRTGLSLLFWGPEQTGKKTVAQLFAASMLCAEHSWGGCRGKEKCAVCEAREKTGILRDYYFVDQKLRARVKESERIDMYDNHGARRMIAFLDTKPIQSDCRVLVVDDAHLVDGEAQNILLKTLEEPPEHAIVVFVTHKPMALFDTVRSRLMQMFFGLVDPGRIRNWLAPACKDEKKLDKAVRYGFMRPGRARALLEEQGMLEGFEKRVKAFLALEAAGRQETGTALALCAAFREKGLFEDSSVFSVWQTVLRDELLMDLDLQDLTALLTKQHAHGTKSDRLRMLRAAMEMELLTDTAPSAVKSALEFLVSSR